MLESPLVNPSEVASSTILPPHLPADAPQGQKVAVCYSASASDRETVMKAAAELCKEPGSTVDIVTEDFYLNDCSYNFV